MSVAEKIRDPLKNPGAFPFRVNEHEISIHPLVILIHAKLAVSHFKNNRSSKGLKVSQLIPKLHCHEERLLKLLYDPLEHN